MHIGNVSRVPLIDIVHDEPEGFPDGEVVGLGLLDGEQTGPAEVVEGEDVVVAVALQQLPLVLLHQLLLEPIVEDTHETQQTEHLRKHPLVRSNNIIYTNQTFFLRDFIFKKNLFEKIQY